MNATPRVTGRGHGKGQSLLDSVELQTAGDRSGLAFLQGLPEGRFITSTATSPTGDTSEFSVCLGEGQEVEPFVVNSIGDDPDENYDPEKSPEEQVSDGICSTGKKADGSDGPCDPALEGDCECTLRAAIQEANARDGKDTIRFDIAGAAPYKIRPHLGLPPVAGPVILDGGTRPGYKGVPLIELDGSDSENFGLSFQSGNNLVRGLAIHSCPADGLSFWGGGGNEIRGNFLGVGLDDASPESPTGNADDIKVTKPGNIIGGVRPSEDACIDPSNLISGNSFGLLINSEGNRIQGNFIGTDRIGTRAIGNKSDQILVQTDNNQIGGVQAGEGNLTSGNGGDRIEIWNGASKIVQGNPIGTDINRIGNLGNAQDGVRLFNKSNNNNDRGSGPCCRQPHRL